MEVVSQLREINLMNFDVVIITRGGGSKLDLSAFDSYEIAKQISEMNLPVICGIGHDIDLSIADMVSALSLKTPTAVANFLIDHHVAFESELYDKAIQIKLGVQQRFKSLEEYLNQYPNQIKNKVGTKLSHQLEWLHKLAQDIPYFTGNILKLKRRTLDNWAEMNHLINPENLLFKGYSITKLNGKIVDSSKAVKKGDELETQFKDGSINSTVK